MRAWEEPKFQRRLLWWVGSLPLGFLLGDWLTGNLGANPPEALIRTTGVIAITFLVLTLLVTPLVKLAHWGWLAKHRRWLGLWCFYYALVHLVCYAGFDRGFAFADIARDIGKRPFILLGFTAFLLLIPLAVTSTNRMIQRLGKRWKKLHRITYVVAPLAAAHYWLIVKSDLFYPKIFAGAFALLLLYRAIQALRSRIPNRHTN